MHISDGLYESEWQYLGQFEVAHRSASWHGHDNISPCFFPNRGISVNCKTCQKTLEVLACLSLQSLWKRIVSSCQKPVCERNCFYVIRHKGYICGCPHASYSFDIFFDRFSLKHTSTASKLILQFLVPFVLESQTYFQWHLHGIVGDWNKSTSVPH